MTADISARFEHHARETRELLAGTSGCSPFLRRLVEKEASWLDQALSRDPDDVLTEIFARATADSSDPPRNLRLLKGRLSLWVALCDLAGIWSLGEVTRALSHFADRTIDCALRSALLPELARGKVPGHGPDDLHDTAGVTILAMGKLGAHELNYSSDIDLIALFDSNRFDRADVAEARAAFVRATRRMCTILSDVTADGYVFRTDLRLRPDAAVTPVCVAMDVAETYYESVGRTWERAAFIKARACAGDIAGGKAFLDRLIPFVWRRHLDFAAIQDAHDMRKAIKAHKGLHGDRLLGRDLKLGRGGIREIEFFTQTRQLIAGGRDPQLRDPGTVSALHSLAQRNWIGTDVAETLAADYTSHRTLEHRLQMVADAQTHMLPRTDEGFERIACFMGEGDANVLRQDLRARVDRVAAFAEQFFSPGEPGKPDGDTDDPAIVKGWARYPALRSPRAVEIFERLKPDLLHRLGKAAKPEEALIAFDGFLSGLPAGVQIFSLFEANPQLRALIVDIAATAPPLARYLSRNSGVLDAVIGGDFFTPWPSVPVLIQDLDNVLDAAADYERQLDAVRRWAKEWHFRVGVHHLRGLTDAETAGRQYAGLAEAVLAALYPRVTASLAEKHGPPPGRGAMVLAMGSLGAGWLNAHSDLDLIIIYDADGDDYSEGPRPLAARPYYARLTQALVTAISAPTAEGKLYDVDTRLRPSGRQGPVATSLSSFRRYHAEEAWTWEHLALTRARPVAGEAGVQQDVAVARAEILTAPRHRAKVLADLADMRARLAQQPDGSGPLETKRGPGHAQDIALFAQAATLLAGDPSARSPDDQLAKARSYVADYDHDTLSRMDRLCRAVMSAGRLVVDGTISEETLGQGGTMMVLRATGAASLAELAQQLQEQAADCARIISSALARG